MNKSSPQNSDSSASKDELLAQAFRDHADTPQETTPTSGDLDLAERNAFRRVTRETLPRPPVPT